MERQGLPGDGAFPVFPLDRQLALSGVLNVRWEQPLRLTPFFNPDAACRKSAFPADQTLEQAKEKKFF
ncbi:hypothetical protein MPNT_20200 [Candidatus Methylacidithermus pantelleriae]|uniref:Uncharacterized protein n=1 Tax=Candidatus Methylacidithermus pantelleriae TaxID=2744239 RepID=A0A8J2FNL1_9BACT|nr:hypothetical protein MPNT_20200 [Candidatus Methylacidithermus pantelleriae]